MPGCLAPNAIPAVSISGSHRPVQPVTASRLIMPGYLAPIVRSAIIPVTGMPHIQARIPVAVMEIVSTIEVLPAVIVIRSICPQPPVRNVTTATTPAVMVAVAIEALFLIHFYLPSLIP